MPAFTEILEERFRELKLFSNRARADWVKTAHTTYSRIVNGRIPLTRKRAEAWAAELYPDDPSAATQFATRLRADTADNGAPVNVHHFFDQMVRSGGAVPAERIADLLKALREVDNPLLLIEYRDIPRAGQEAKYQSLGEDLGKAVAHGLSVGMFMPFKSPSPTPADADEGQSKAVKFMTEVRDECRLAYRTFRRNARAHLPKKRFGEVKERLKLYEPDDEVLPTLGSGFQAKMFYLQYDTSDGETVIRHHRILQWVATPTRDHLIYRGELLINPAALRDSFFPVPHAFEVALKEDGRPHLPDLPSSEAGKAQREEALETLRERWEGFGLPLDRTLWTSFDAA